MSKQIPCPATDCGYTDTLDEFLTQFKTTSDPAHTWETLDYRSETAFRISTHDERLTEYRDAATRAEDAGDYEAAIRNLEHAIEHAQQAAACVKGTDTRFAETARTLLGEIERVEQVAAERQLDAYLTTAANNRDTGDQTYLKDQERAAIRAYARAERALARAAEIATDTLPARHAEIAARQDQLQLRHKSLQGADTHRRVRTTLNTARDHRDRGDSAFKSSEYQSALDAYQQAKDAYSKVASALTTFEFETATREAPDCDLCRQAVDAELTEIELEGYRSQRVCPACSHFAADGVLPTPRDVRNERTTVEENIENLKTGDHGLDWTTPPTTTTSGPTEQSTAAGPAERDLLLELIQVTQSVEGTSSPADLDANTSYGHQAYVEIFGGIAEAMRAAGFDQ